MLTGHTADGKAIFVDDTLLTSLDPRTNEPQFGNRFGNATIWRTEGIPPRINEPFTDLHGKPLGVCDPHGVVCRTIHFPPQGEVPDDYNIMHRTQSEDFGIVIEGEIDLLLEGGERTTLKKGNVVVQRGTNHVSSAGHSRDHTQYRRANTSTAMD
jgi:quercetin dioxygenase-like cupin family protein